VGPDQRHAAGDSGLNVGYDQAVQALYQAPLSQFVAERKRLAAELKASADAAGSKHLLERKRPTVSAWVVNQLYWHARDGFDRMLATAEQLRKGRLNATADHRDAIASLRKRAAAMLEDSGHAPTEATLRRVTTTLAALAATGGFDPDLPGTLATDREPPGFEAFGVPAAAPEQGEPKPHDRAREREQRHEQEQRKRRAVERHELELALRTARVELDTRKRAVRELEQQLEASTKQLEDAQTEVDRLAAKLAKLDRRRAPGI
jgi:hypothetical protein